MRVVIDAQNRADLPAGSGPILGFGRTAPRSGLRSQQISRCQPSSAPSSISAAIVIRHDLAAADTAAHFHALARKHIAELAAAGDGEIGRPAIKRRSEFAGRHARALDDRLVIAGEKAITVAELADPQRPEIVLEEFARAVLFERNGCNGAFANSFERVADRRGTRAGLPLFQRAATFKK